MPKEVVRYVFVDSVSMHEVEETLFLAVLATEGLHGEATVRLQASYCIDASQHLCTIDVGNEVGSMLCRIFTSFITREFGSHAFEVQRNETPFVNETTACSAA